MADLSYVWTVYTSSCVPEGGTVASIHATREGAVTWAQALVDEENREEVALQARRQARGQGPPAFADDRFWKKEPGECELAVGWEKHHRLACVLVRRREVKP